MVIIIIVHSPKLRLRVRRATRCLIPCERVLSPSSVMLVHLRKRRNEISNRYYYSLPEEVKADRVESYKMLDRL